MQRLHTTSMSTVSQKKNREGFLKDQWLQAEGRGTCKTCQTRRCLMCYAEKGKSAFTYEMWNAPYDTDKVHCKLCMASKRKVGWWTCYSSHCKKQLPKEDFKLAHATKSERQLTKTQNRLCDTCIEARHAVEMQITTDNVRHVVHRRPGH